MEESDIYGALSVIWGYLWRGIEIFSNGVL